MKKILSLLIYLCLFFPIYGENILGEMSGILQLESNSITSEVELGLEDLTALDYLYDNPFVQGIELKFTIPESTRNYRNSFALYLYRTVRPLPDQNITSYRGNQFFMQILPFSSEFYVKIPFNENNNIRKDADSVVTTPVNRNDFPALITMLPIMKGLPSQARSVSIRMSARPLFINRGGLKIIIENKEDFLESQTNILIDDVRVSWPEEYYSLEPGFHRVLIRNELTGDREFNIAIEEGKFTEIRYTLEEAAPRLRINSQKGVIYYLDGELLENNQLDNSMIITSGDHTLTVKFNNDLSLTKEFSIKAGENHTISLDTQILIEKD